MVRPNTSHKFKAPHCGKKYFFIPRRALIKGIAAVLDSSLQNVYDDIRTGPKTVVPRAPKDLNRPIKWLITSHYIDVVWGHIENVP